VARRADVLVIRRRLGFGAEGRRERFAVLQSDLLTDMETVIVAPLDDSASMYEDDPLAVHASPKEAGTRGGQVVLVHLVAAVRLDRFESVASGRLSPKTMNHVDDALRTALEL